MADDQDGTSTPSSDETTPSEDTKAKFREALARKQESDHMTADGRRNTGAVHGSEVAGGGKRTFRRKTG